MLKIERLSKDRKISITVKDRTKLFTPRFALALALAFAVHFLGAVLFHIDLGVLSTARDSLSAMIVSSDHTIWSKASPHFAEQAPIDNPYLVLAPPVGPIPTSYFPAIRSHLFKTQTRVEKLETALATSIDIPKKEPVADHLVPIRLHLSRGLSLQQYSLEVPQLIARQGFSAHLEVKVDPSTGKIFWMDWKQSNGDRKTNHEIEELLKSLKFKLDSQINIAKGEIDIFTVPE